MKEERERIEREERQRERDALALSRQKFVEEKKEILKKPIEVRAVMGISQLHPCMR